VAERPVSAQVSGSAVTQTNGQCLITLSYKKLKVIYSDHKRASECC